MFFLLFFLHYFHVIFRGMQSEFNTFTLNIAFDMLCFTCLWFASQSVFFLDLVKQASLEARLSLAADRHRTHYTLWHKLLNESAHLLKGLLPPWCLDMISPHFVLNLNDWRRCAFILDYWGLNLIELKRLPANHITLSFRFTARRQKPPLAVTRQDTEVGVPAGSYVPQP